MKKYIFVYIFNRQIPQKTLYDPAIKLKTRPIDWKLISNPKNTLKSSKTPKIEWMRPGITTENMWGAFLYEHPQEHRI